nr:hypothetical protein [Tanacetum cinerariifolium]
MNQNNKDRQLSVFEIDANDDETGVVFLEQAYAYHQQLVAEENRLPLTRNLINRDREGAEERLMADYFNDHCRVRPDATGRMSLSVIMKCTAAIRQLAYGTTPDAFDEYLQMNERTARENNDINVLDNSSLFDDLLNDTAPVLPYVVNGVGYEKWYYLADGIYPQWATFVKSFMVSNDAKHAYFKKRQEGARKDVKRASGVLQGHQKLSVFDWNEVNADPARNMTRTWIERCETQRRKNKEMRDRDTDEDIDLINDDDDSTSVTVAVAGTPTVTTTTAVTPSTIDSRRLFQKLWTDEDEIELLQGYYDHITTRGMMTSSSHHHHDTTAFYDEIKGKLQLEFNKNQLVEKLRRLKKKYRNVVRKIASGKEFVFKSPHDQATFDISCKIWNNDDEVQNHNFNGNGNGNEIGDMEKKVRSRKRARSSGVKIEEGYVQPLQQFGHGLGVGMGNEGGVSRNVNANVVEEMVKSCLLPLFKELANNSSNGGSRGLGLGGMNLDAFGIGDMSDDKCRKQHILELEVYLKRLELMQDQVKSRLDELRYYGINGKQQRYREIAVLNTVFKIRISFRSVH